MINKEFMTAVALRLGIELDNTAIDKLDKYAEILVEWNKKFNLTAITEPDEIVIRHFSDSLYLANKLSTGQSLIDVGTGAGFPGVVAAIYRTDVKVTLLDSIGKRTDFLAAVCNDVGVDAEILTERAEVVANDPDYRQKFDAATARAVAPLNVVAEYCTPFVKVGGSLLAMCGKTADEEINRAANAMELLGMGTATADRYVLEDRSERAIVSAVKLTDTPEKYPRRSAKIKKDPL